MDIQELASGTQPTIIQPILDSFNFPGEKQSIVLKNFGHEFEEIGTNRVVLLGIIESLPVSTVQLVLTNADNNPELANGREIAHVHNLWVRKDYQRRGLAENIMKHGEALASKRGIKVLTLGVDDYNAGAIALYKKLGYMIFAEEEGRTPQEKLFLMRKLV